MCEPDVLNTMARVWEPTAGDGNIVHVLRDNGIPVIASDIEKGKLRIRSAISCSRDEPRSE